MSACEVRIVFDRRDRVYRGGDIVRGQVVVRAQSNVQCEGLNLQRFWQTAGDGTIDRGRRVSAQLFAGMWEAGQTYSYDFHFTAPAAPLTCKGRHVQIEHFVEAHAVVPWAFDPRAKEPFTVLPGGEGGQIETGPIATEPTGIDLRAVLSSGTGVAAGVGIVFLGFIVFPLAFLLVPAGIVVLAASALMNHARKKVGSVRIGMPANVWPGQRAPVRLTFSPPGPLTVNGITARLVGTERTRRGSGKNATTHKRVFHDHVGVLHGPGEVSAGGQVAILGEVSVPVADMLSLDAEHNKIIWTLELRIDIPLWPDWVDRRVLRVMPTVREDADPRELASARSDKPIEVHRVEPLAEPTMGVAALPVVAALPTVQPLPQGPPAVAAIGSAADVGVTIGAAPAAPRPPLWSDDDDAADAGAPAAADAPPPSQPIEPETAAARADVAASPAAEPTASLEPEPCMVEAIDRIAAADRFGGDRERVLGEASGHLYQITLIPERVEWTISMTSAAEYRSGRTVVGKLESAARPIAVRFPDALSAEIEGVATGQPLTVTARIVEWNSLYDRAECEALTA